MYDNLKLNLIFNTDEISKHKTCFRIDVLSDSLLAAALPLMLGLQEIVLDHCDNVTAASLWSLLEQPNDLISLQCWQCKLTTPKDRDEIRATIKEENLSVYFEWYPYSEEEEALLEAGYLNIDSEDDEGSGVEGEA